MNIIIIIICKYVIIVIDLNINILLNLMFENLTIGGLYMSFLYGISQFVNKYLGHTEYIMNIDDNNILLNIFRKYCDDYELYGKYINVYCDGSKNSMVLISLCYNTFDNFTVVFDNNECFNKMNRYLDNYDINCEFDFDSSEEDNIMLSHLSNDYLFGSYFYDLINNNSTSYFKKPYNDNYYYPFYNIKQIGIDNFLESYKIYYLDDKNSYDDEYDYIKTIMVSRFCNTFLPDWQSFLTEYYYTQKEIGNYEDFEGLHKMKFGSYININNIKFRQLNKLLELCCEYEHICIDNKEQLYNVINNNENNCGQLNDNYFYYYENNVLYLFNQFALINHFIDNLVVSDNNDVSVCSYENLMNGNFTYKCVGNKNYCSLNDNTMILDNKYSSGVLEYVIEECWNHYDFPNFGDGVVVTTCKNENKSSSLLGMFF